MNIENKSVILAESSRLISQIGNNIVLDLYARVREVEALTRTLGATVEQLPKSEALFRQLIPSIINFQGDLSIAGGGVWPEPNAFAPDLERRSFFWGRSAGGELKYFDDYNQPGPGYHQEAWYVMGRYAHAGQCVWSASYMDPYSYQPMITCTAPIFETGSFSGAVTIDLKLEGLQAFVEVWRQQTGGYVCILDRNNRFITFPDPSVIKTTTVDNRGQSIDAFMFADELAAAQPLFLPLANALNEMNRTILERAATTPSYCGNVAKNLARESYQIGEAEAALVAAILTDPLSHHTALNQHNTATHLYQKFEIETDFLLKEASTVFLFYVPQTYWKVVIVKPFSEAIMATYSIIQSEKMSSLGQLVAGVAHEVNNPVNFIYGNLTYADIYTQDLMALVKLYQQHYPDPPLDIQRHLEQSDFDFMITDLPKILASMKVGADRIRQLVMSLRNFARMDEASMKLVDIHEGLESTLLLIDSRLKLHADAPGIQIIRAYGDLPRIECYPGPLNQVFMNILINAIDALEEAINQNKALGCLPSFKAAAPDPAIAPPTAVPNQPTIRIQTGLIDRDRVAIRLADNGPGIPDAVQQRLFDPFFTTKPVGKGTGLGLAICYQIVTEKHQGQLTCTSIAGQGTEFVIEIPIRQLASN